MPSTGNHLTSTLNVVAGLKIDNFSREKMKATEKELIEEKELAYSCLN